DTLQKLQLVLRRTWMLSNPSHDEVLDRRTSKVRQPHPSVRRPDLCASLVELARPLTTCTSGAPSDEPSVDLVPQRPGLLDKTITLRTPQQELELVPFRCLPRRKGSPETATHAPGTSAL